jgi:LPS export ABC transporter protein LptC
MSLTCFHRTYLIISNITAVSLAAVMFVLLTGCSNQKKNFTEEILNRDSLPTMQSLGVTTLISDSGITRYKIVAEEWNIFDKKNPPYWAFEKGVYLEKFDTLLRIDANILADTAYYFEKKKLWELRGNVKILSLQGDKFETQQLFWDEKNKKIYSDKYIRIEQTDKEIEGYGFEANQELTEYEIKKTTGVFTIEDKASADLTQPTDSLRN